jgi:beta-glucanase (GH16 family)
MKSQFWATNTLSIPWFKIGEKPRKTSILRRFTHNLRKLQEQLVTCAFVAGVVVLLASTGSFSQSSTPMKTSPATLGKLYASSLTPRSFPTNKSVATKPPKATAHATIIPACAKEQPTLFATCPTFSLNFATQPTGSLSTKDFNIYSGQPLANQEAELYTNSQKNLQVENGSLDLKALNDPQQGYNYTSARIDTEGKEDFMYGKIVVRATLPDGIGTWPAIWMLSTDNKYESLSPASDPDRFLNDGEIDIAESIGTQPNVVYGIAHSLAYPADGIDRSYFNTITVPGNDSVPHDYEVDWTPTNLTFIVDNTPYFSINKQPGATYQSWPYDQPFYLILNLALGGSWGGTDRAQFPADGVDPSSLPATMQVQSINYYPYIGTPAASNN